MMVIARLRRNIRLSHYATMKQERRIICCFEFQTMAECFMENIAQHDSNTRLPVVFDMETGDPDDFVTLLLLLGHPKVHLKAITIVPGTPDQIGFIRYVLNRFNRTDLPIGVFNINAKPGLSKFHYKIYQNVHIDECRDAFDGSDLILQHCDEQTTLICGGPLKNLAKAIEKGGLKLGRLVAQGGFAGDNIVPKEKRLSKFDGRITCPTFNLSADIKAAHIVLNTDLIKEKYFVSKNVCHGVIYNDQIHRQLQIIQDRSQSLGEIYHMMSVYLNRRGRTGKAFHDPLTACCAIDLSIGQWQDVRLFMDEKTKEWGSSISDHPNVKIIVDYDHQKFLQTLFQY